jgi:hypothetical protein
VKNNKNEKRKEERGGSENKEIKNVKRYSNMYAMTWLSRRLQPAYIRQHIEQGYAIQVSGQG